MRIRRKETGNELSAAVQEGRLTSKIGLLLFSRLITSGVIFLGVVFFCGANAAAYSVLTHQELIDLAWNDSIRPLLLARFPDATEELREAHDYAYGGSAIVKGCIRTRPPLAPGSRPVLLLNPSTKRKRVDVQSTSTA
jgi:hypothetical protein